MPKHMDLIKLHLFYLYKHVASLGSSLQWHRLKHTFLKGAHKPGSAQGMCPAAVWPQIIKPEGTGFWAKPK